MGAPRLFTGSALTAGPFWQTAPKGTKKALPQRSAFAALRFPLSGSAAQARRDGPSMAQHDSPGFLPGDPLRKTYARPAEGACRSRSNAKQSKAKTLCVLALKNQLLPPNRPDDSKAPCQPAEWNRCVEGNPAGSRVSAVGHGCPYGAAHGAAME